MFVENRKFTTDFAFIFFDTSLNPTQDVTISHSKYTQCNIVVKCTDGKADYKMLYLPSCGKAIPFLLCLALSDRLRLPRFQNKSYAEGMKAMKHEQFFALQIFSLYFIPPLQKTLTLRRERLSVRVIGKHFSRVTLFVPASCHSVLLAACHWSLAGSGAFLAHRIHDLADALVSSLIYASGSKATHQQQICSNFRHD